MKKSTALFISSIIMLTSGMFLVVNPMKFVSIICYILGIISIASAVFKFINAYKNSIFGFNTFSCVSLFVLGIVLIVLQASLLNIIPFVIGICFLIYGLIKLQNAFSFKAYDDMTFKKLLFPAVIEVILAILIIVLSGLAIDIVLRFTGVLLIYNAAENIYSFIIANKASKSDTNFFKEKDKNKISADFEENNNQ